MATTLERSSSKKIETEIKDKLPLMVVIDSLNVGVESLKPFTERILKAARGAGIDDTKILLSMHSGLDPKAEATKKAMEREFGPKVKGHIVKDGTFAYAYTSGLDIASQQAQRVIELDSGGGHLPEDLEKFIEGLDTHDVVLASRFMPGGKNTYPLQRQLVSRGVTVLSNAFLGTKLTDAASGYQGFKAVVLRDLFDRIPPDQWLSVTQGPFHMYQTEMRAYLSSLKGVDCIEVPIAYGMEKKGAKLGVPYLMEAMGCFYQIWKNMPRVRDGK